MRLNTLPKAVFVFGTACLLCIALYSPLLAATDKVDQHQREYRIAYLEGGPLLSFSGVLNSAKKALARRGWLDRIEFPPELHLSQGWHVNAVALRKYAKELFNRKDVDLILSAGTDATQAVLAVNNGRIPIVAFGASDPIKSKLVPNAADSGVDNFTILFEPNIYKTQFRIFSLAVDFHKLGIIYSSGPNGKVYANLQEAHEIARERGFQLIEYGKVSDDATEEDCMTGLKWLVGQGMDAFYISSLPAFDYVVHPQGSQKLLRYLIAAKIPTFAADGTIGVKSGALLGFSNVDFTRRGEFLANMIICILQGAKPRSLPMVFHEPHSLSLNMYTADKIGYHPPIDLLTSCDIIFRKISVTSCPPSSAR